MILILLFKLIRAANALWCFDRYAPVSIWLSLIITFLKARLLLLNWFCVYVFVKCCFDKYFLANIFVTVSIIVL